MVIKGSACEYDFISQLNASNDWARSIHVSTIVLVCDIHLPVEKTSTKFLNFISLRDVCGDLRYAES